MRKVICPTEADTKKLSESLAGELQAPCVIAIKGDLGAGKTTFVRYFVQALAKEKVRVKSPTFSYAHTYDTQPPVHHLDLYRLTNAESARELCLIDYLTDKQAIAIVEWPEVIFKYLPQGTLYIDIDDNSSSGRIFTISRDAAT